MRAKNTYTSLALSTCLPIIASVVLMSAPAAQAGKGKDQAPGQSEKVDVCHVNGNGKIKMLSLPLDAALSHLEHHDGADFLPTDGDCDQSNDCVLGSDPNEITVGLYNLLIEKESLVEDSFIQNIVAFGAEFVVESTSASVVESGSCSIQADLQVSAVIVETGESGLLLPLTAINYDFPNRINNAVVDFTGFLSEEQISACKITLGCD